MRSGIPRITLATQENFIPQSVNLDLIGGVSFSKGCYPGQEIVARVRYLGRLKHRMARAIVAHGELPSPGDPVFLNLETTRHNEIQVIGNGDWAVALGGRDCSIQMREQKQLEFSLTSELLEEAAGKYSGAKAENLSKDCQTLLAMERDAEAFGQGVGLASVSTFECIVEGFDHFFMEMNTRLQVEHPVTEAVTDIDIVSAQFDIAAGAVSYTHLTLPTILLV